MKRLLLAITLAGALSVAMTGVAQARTTVEMCGLKDVGAPVIHGSTSITSTGVSRCNVKWRAIADLQVEQDGTWATVFSDGQPVAPQPVGPYAAKTDHSISFAWGILDPSPYCAYNWRIGVTYTDMDGTQIAFAYSPTTPMTCSRSLRS